MGYNESHARRKLIAINAYFQKQQESQINNYTLQLKKLEKELNPKIAKGRK